MNNKVYFLQIKNNKDNMKDVFVSKVLFGYVNKMQILFINALLDK